MLSPIFVGVVFGTKCVSGLLAGAIASGVQMAISASNTGGECCSARANDLFAICHSSSWNLLPTSACSLPLDLRLATGYRLQLGSCNFELATLNLQLEDLLIAND